jgi:hypothetical protein
VTSGVRGNDVGVADSRDLAIIAARPYNASPMKRSS